MTKVPDCRECRECAWVIEFQRPSCIAPQLVALGDGPPGKVPRVTDCEGARYFKEACGHAAAWFVKKGSLHGC